MSYLLRNTSNLLSRNAVSSTNGTGTPSSTNTTTNPNSTNAPFPSSQSKFASLRSLSSSSSTSITSTSSSLLLGGVNGRSFQHQLPFKSNAVVTPNQQQFGNGSRGIGQGQGQTQLQVRRQSSVSEVTIAMNTKQQQHHQQQQQGVISMEEGTYVRTDAFVFRFAVRLSSSSLL
jgi:hypothetical protein